MFKCLDHGPNTIKDSVNIFRMFTLEPERAQSQEILKYFIFTTRPFQSLLLSNCLDIKALQTSVFRL